LQETSNKDLSLLAKSAFELLKWRILHRPSLETAITSILSSVSDPNWRTRSALLSYLRTFTYRFDKSLAFQCNHICDNGFGQQLMFISLMRSMKGL
jgi:hypothetical protein